MLKKIEKETSNFIRYGVLAAYYALVHAGLHGRLEEFYMRTRCGVSIGNGGTGSVEEMTVAHDQLRQVLIIDLHLINEKGLRLKPAVCFSAVSRIKSSRHIS